MRKTAAVRIIAIVFLVIIFSIGSVSEIHAGFPGMINVKELGAKGDGVSDDTEAIRKAVANYQEIIFPPGVYLVSSPLNFAKSGIRIRGIGRAEIYFDGGGRAVSFDAGNGYMFDMVMENITIRGTRITTDGLYIRGCHHLRFKDIRVTDVSESAFRFDFTIFSTFTNLVASVNEGGFRVTPKYGLFLSRRSAGETPNSNVFENLMIEGVSVRGIHIEFGESNLFLGGTSEGNPGIGLVFGQATEFNTFLNFYCEGNKKGDVDDQGRVNRFINSKCDEKLQVNQ